MKKMLLLAFFGLVVRMAVAQVWSINSPTTDNLNCLIMDSTNVEANFPTLFVFGDHGRGYVTTDKCKTWTTLDIDPVLKRDINLSARVNDSVIFISGGLENNLLKYSTDNGATFQDFTPLDPTQNPVRSLIPLDGLYKSVIAFNQVGVMNFWTQEWGIVPINLFQPYAVTPLTAVMDSDYVRIITVAENYATYDNVFTVSSFKLIKDDINTLVKVNTEIFFDSITSVDSYKGVAVVGFYMSYRYREVPVQFHSMEGVLKSYTAERITDFRELPQLGKEMTIKASLVSHANLLFWHVGGDVNGQNGFMIRDGVIIKEVPDAALKAIADCSYNGIDAAIAIGNNGKIYATRSDLSLATANAIVWRDEDKLSAYPNPFSSELTVKSSVDCIVSLNDILGTTIKQIHLRPGVNSLSLADLRPGIYLLNNKKQTLKIVKQ